MNREERSSVEDDQREHGTMGDEGRKKQVQVTRRSWRHKVTSVDANTPFRFESKPENNSSEDRTRTFRFAAFLLSRCVKP